MVTAVRGGLDKGVITRVIRNGNSQIKYCYEAELQKKPKLSGKVAVAWVIDAEGRVSAATIAEDTMGDTAVASCIVARVKEWGFPKPIGGGVVNVTFPWIFRPAGN